MDDEAAVRATLLAKERELLAQIETITRPQQDSGSISFGKRIGDGTALAVDRMSAVTIHGDLLASLAQVRHALARLNDGDYGTCDLCGEQIAPARLEARPWATRCIRHA